MKLYDNPSYIEDLEQTSALPLEWDKLQNKKILISGATGLIGSFLVDTIMLNNRKGLDCQLFVLTRDVNEAKKRFSIWADNACLHILSHDVNHQLFLSDQETMDYVMHLASNTHPVQYAKDPIGTISTNIIGLKNMLDFASEHHSKRFLFASSNEIYGENRGDTELFDEAYCGYIDCNTLRAGYPESKRCGEALCQAYRIQKKMDVVIARLTRSYGPTMRMSDSKAVSQFLKKGFLGEDIVLKSKGNQYYSYTYVSDAVGGVLTILLNGKDGEAYNIADESSDIRLKDLARTIAGIAGTKVIFDLPDETEAAGFSKATKARLDGSKLRSIGWKPRYSIQKGIERTMNMMADEQPPAY